MSNRQDDALPDLRGLLDGAMRFGYPLKANGAYQDLCAAIASLQARLDAAEKDAARVPAGWKLVPIEPTPAMQLAGVTANGSVLFKHGSVEPLPGDGPTTRARMDYLVSYALKAYRAMLAAAPEAA